MNESLISDIHVIYTSHNINRQVQPRWTGPGAGATAIKFVLCPPLPPPSPKKSHCPPKSGWLCASSHCDLWWFRSWS